MKVEYCYDDRGFSPFEFWSANLMDKVLKARINARLERILEGNFGDHKYLDEGVWEIRLHFNGGIRIYYGIYKDEVVLLLAGGDKKSQARDIKNAISFWKSYMEKK